MRTRTPPAPAIACAAMLCCAGALADTITLKNGSRLEGVVEETKPGPKCEPCKGAGEVSCPACGRGGRAAPACVHCGGKGRAKCSVCKGRGSGEASYVIRLRGGARTTMREGEVVSIEKGRIPPEDLMPPRRSYAARVAGLAADDAQGNLDLARWALERGLLVEASKHARRAAELDDALRAEARKVYVAADGKRTGPAAAAVAASFQHVREGRLAEGLAALDAAIRAHAGNPLFTDPEREKAFLEERAPDVAARHGSTFAAILRSLRRRVDLACPKCSGVGASRCATCSGSGDGACTRCAGAGETWCKECNGTKWRVCIRCGGTGKPSGTQFGASKCPDCAARGIVNCARCKKGRIACAPCAGKGKAAGGCRTCSGKGSLGCVPCLDTGMRPPRLLNWGPAPEIEPGPVIVAADAEAEGRFPVWQGMRRGCIITAVRAEDLHEGALTEQLAAVTGARREILLLCVDNRDGRDQVEFAPAEQGLRLVTGEARQVDAVPPTEVKVLAAKRPSLAPALEQLRPTAVLPGVTVSVVGAFPGGTDLAGAVAVYWGRRDPLRLVRHYVSARTIAAIRKTMR
ncbi:MAG: hypothetical protein ACYTKD_12050 [Planctomycetota bacterium]